MDGQKQLLQPPYSSQHALLDTCSPVSPPPDHLAIPGTAVLHKDRVFHYVSSELNVSRLNAIDQYLKFASRPGPTRPLHQRKSNNHSIAVDERADWHLVCWRTGVFVKPLPRFLLDHDFFLHVLCASPTLHADACGMLLSYTDLIAHQSDFDVAVEYGLVPKGVQWMQWAAFMADVQSSLETDTVRVNQRYRYGELKRRELLIVNWLVHGWKKRYYYIFQDYVTFGLANYGQLLAVFATATVLLSALQVGLATRQGMSPGRFADMSWGLALVMVAALFVSAWSLGVFLVVYYLGTMWVTLKYDKKRRRRTPGGQQEEIAWGYEP